MEKMHLLFVKWTCLFGLLKCWQYRLPITSCPDFCILLCKFRIMCYNSNSWLSLRESGIVFSWEILSSLYFYVYCFLILLSRWSRRSWIGGRPRRLATTPLYSGGTLSLYYAYQKYMNILKHFCCLVFACIRSLVFT